MGYGNVAIKLLTIYLFTSFLADAAFALNVNFLKDSILAEFSEEEAVEFKQFVANTLDDVKDLKSVVWKSSTSDMAGKLLIMSTYSSEGVSCRRSRFIIKNAQKKEPFQFEICKREGRWAIEATPIQSFTDEDWKIFEKSIEVSLNNGANGEELSWSNPKTGNSGSHTPLTKVENDEGVCRRISITIVNKLEQSLDGTYTLCKPLGEGWKRVVKD